MISLKKPALFLDRDGVIVKDKGYVYKVEDLEILPNVGPSLKKAQDEGFLLIVVTNQSGVARGYFSLEDVARFHRQLDQELWEKWQVRIDAYYVCPHHPNGSVDAYRIDCLCRKPGTGLIDHAKDDFPIDFSKSYMIGDKASDVDCGARLGLPTLQIVQGQYPQHPSPWKIVKNLAEALDVIFQN